MPDSNSFTRPQPWVKWIKVHSAAGATEHYSMCKAPFSAF